MTVPLEIITDSGFPIDVKMFEFLRTVPSYKLRGHRINEDGSKEFATDFNIIYWMVISKMEEQGVQFFSPGGSYKRRFINWFYNLFWGNMKSKVHIEEKWINKLCDLVVNNLKIPVKFDACEEVTITGSSKLNQLGKDLLLQVEPFASFKGKVVFS